MATEVFLENVRANGDEALYIFRVIGNHQVIKVKSFDDGVVTILCMDAEDLTLTATTIAGLLDEESNFLEKLCEIYKKPKDETIKALNLTHPSWDGMLEVKKPT